MATPAMLRMERCLTLLQVLLLLLTQRAGCLHQSDNDVQMMRGSVYVSIRGSWRPVCTHTAVWTSGNTKVICRQVKDNTNKGYEFEPMKFAAHQHKWITTATCQGDEVTLSDCPGHSWHRLAASVPHPCHTMSPVSCQTPYSKEHTEGETSTVISLLPSVNRFKYHDFTRQTPITRKADSLKHVNQVNPYFPNGVKKSGVFRERLKRAAEDPDSRRGDSVGGKPVVEGDHGVSIPSPPSTILTAISADMEPSAGEIHEHVKSSGSQIKLPDQTHSEPDHLSPDKSHWHSGEPTVSQHILSAAITSPQNTQVFETSPTAPGVHTLLYTDTESVQSVSTPIHPGRRNTQSVPFVIPQSKLYIPITSRPIINEPSDQVGTGLTNEKATPNTGEGLYSANNDINVGVDGHNDLNHAAQKTVLPSTVNKLVDTQANTVKTTVATEKSKVQTVSDRMLYYGRERVDLGKDRSMYDQTRHGATLNEIQLENASPQGDVVQENATPQRDLPKTQGRPTGCPGDCGGPTEITVSDKQTTVIWKPSPTFHSAVVTQSRGVQWWPTNRQVAPMRPTVHQVAPPQIMAKSSVVDLVTTSTKMTTVKPSRGQWWPTPPTVTTKPEPSSQPSPVIIIPVLTTSHTQKDMRKPRRRLYICPGYKDTKLGDHTAGQITSPFYPEFYPPYLNCSWKLVTTPDRVFKIQVLDFVTEKSHDKLFVQAGDVNSTTRRLIYTLQGSLTDNLGGILDKKWDLVTNSSQLWLTFRTDGSRSQSRGFRIHYTTIHKHTVTGGWLLATTKLSHTAMAALIALAVLVIVATGLLCKLKCGAGNNSDVKRRLYQEPCPGQTLQDYRAITGTTADVQVLTADSSAILDISDTAFLIENGRSSTHNYQNPAYQPASPTPTPQATPTITPRTTPTCPPAVMSPLSEDVYLHLSNLRQMHVSTKVTNIQKGVKRCVPQASIPPCRAKKYDTTIHTAKSPPLNHTNNSTNHIQSSKHPPANQASHSANHVQRIKSPPVNHNHLANDANGSVNDSVSTSLPVDQASTSAIRVNCKQCGKLQTVPKPNTLPGPRNVQHDDGATQKNRIILADVARDAPVKAKGDVDNGPQSQCMLCTTQTDQNTACVQCAQCNRQINCVQCLREHGQTYEHAVKYCENERTTHSDGVPNQQTVQNEDMPSSADGDVTVTLQMITPGDFICPLTGRVMRWPVTDPQGHSFDRAAILRWLSQHEVCPVTGHTLEAGSLSPNPLLQGRVSEWRARRKLQRQKLRAATNKCDSVC